MKGLDTIANSIASRFQSLANVLLCLKMGVRRCLGPGSKRDFSVVRGSRKKGPQRSHNIKTRQRIAKVKGLNTVITGH